MRMRCSLVLLSFWLVIGTAYVWTARQQAERVNLSATAGGQYPYLANAESMAARGVLHDFGDRNRMPLVPAMLSIWHTDDWQTFVGRSKWFAIVSSLILWVVLGAVAYALLPTLSATAFTLAAVVCVFIDKASFVQAELVYYALFFLAWIAMCRVIKRPRPGWAVLAGLAAGMAYYAKASALLLVGVFAVVMAVRTLVDPVAHRKAAESSSIDNGQTGRPARTAANATLTIAVFLLVIAPYLLDNHERYGRVFYNVNSTFFFWCDSWQQAKDFADSHNLANSYPDAAAEAIPSPRNYFRTHDLRSSLDRAFYGLKTLAELAWAGRYAKFLIAAIIVCLWLGRRRIRHLRDLDTSNALVALFCATALSGYLSVYAWYAVVAHGDRFLLSLYLPALWAALWGIDRFDRTASPIVIGGRRWRPANVFAAVMVVWLLAEGAWLTTRGLYQPTENYVRFYFNESRERERLGDIEEAVRGYRGVIELRPSFAPAHHELGMVALKMGRLDMAADSLAQAATLSPNDANILNSYGSVLAQTGRLDEAIDLFQRATVLDPTFSMAWFNLGGSFLAHGDLAQAEGVQRRLRTLAPDLARQLGELWPAKPQERAKNTPRP